MTLNVAAECGQWDMQYKKLTKEQQRIRSFRLRRNRLVCKLLDEDKRLTRAEALRLANKLLHKK